MYRRTVNLNKSYIETENEVVDHGLWGKGGENGGNASKMQ